MKKKILSWIMVFAMLLTMFPQTAFASTSPVFGYRWTQWNDTTQQEEEDLNQPIQTVLDASYPSGSPVFFYFVDENGVETRLSAKDLTSSNEDVVTIEADEDVAGLVHLSYVDFGNATIDYVYNNTTYSVDITVGLPNFGFYKAPVATKENYLPELTVTEDNSTVYLVARNDLQITGISFMNGLGDIATLESIDSTRTYATIKITGTPENNRWYYANCDSVNSEGQVMHTQIAGITLFNGKPSLMFRWPDWNNGPIESPNNRLQSFYNNAVGNNNSLFFYLVNGDEETRLSASDLTVSNEDILRISEDSNNEDAVFVELLNFGSATIDYTYNDVTHSVNVTCELPPVGFYSSTTATQETYLNTFTVTEDSNIFYLVARNNWILTDVTLQESLQNIASVSLDSTGTFATITVTGTPERDRWYGVQYNAENAATNSSMEGNGVGLNLINGKPSLMFRHPAWDNGPVENTFADLRNSGNSTPGSSESLFFYFVNGDEETRLSASDLTSSDETILRVVEDSNNAAAVRIEALDFGSATIDYTVNNVTYSVNFTVELPPIGLYSETITSEETFLREFTVTEDSDTFYLVARYGWQLTEVSLLDNFSNIASVSMSSDNTYAAITVTGTPEDGRWYNVQFSAVQPEHNNQMTNNNWGIKLLSGKPSLMYRWAEWNNGPYEDLNQNLENSYRNAPGYDNALFFYYVENGEEVRLSASDLTSSDENVVRIFEHPDNTDAVLVEAVGFGNATISYEKNGITYNVNVTMGLPQLGYYTTPTASEASYIRSFTVTDNNDTFYLAATDGWKITRADLMGDFAAIATCTLDESGDYAIIQVTGTPENNYWYELSLDSYHPEYDNYNSFSANIQLSTSKPTLMFDWEGDLNTTYINAKGVNMDFAFYLVENNNKTLVTAKDLVSGNENILKISECPIDKNLVNLELVGWGETTINYTAEDGSTYSLRVICQLPPVGYYSSPAATEDTFIGQQFTLTDANNTFYLIRRDNWTFDSFSADEYLEQIADVTISNDRKILTISITGDPEEFTWYHIEVNGSSSYGITIIDERTPADTPEDDVTTVFPDVKENAWYLDAVQYVYDNGIMSGNNGLFNPTKSVTRAQVVTTLYNLENRPEVIDYSACEELMDVEAGQWYTDAVCWAYSVGVANGNASTKMFYMSNPVTRQQLATFFYNYAELKGLDITTRGDYSDLAGADEVGSYAADTMRWAYGTGLITGSATTGADGMTVYNLNPKGTATRAQMASILQRFCQNNEI